MRPMLALAPVLMLAAPAPLLAQADPDIQPDPAIDAPAEEKAAALAERLRDPAVQEQASEMLAAMSQVLLDVRVAPLAEAVARATGEPVDDIDPDQRLRDLAPRAEYLQDDIRREVPYAMERFAGMGEAMALMLPALREMAAEVGRALDESAISTR